MFRTRSTPIRSTFAIAALVTITAGCSQIAERATEEAVERAVESGSDEDVDIDFGDGEISIESEEGNLTINADESGVAIDGTDADGNDFSLNADETGLEANSDEAGSLDVDADGSFTATDGDGDVTTGDIDVDGDGLNVDGADGESVFNTGEGIPDQWPSDVPEPDGLDDIFGTYVAEGGEESFVVAGSANGSAEEVFDDYVGRLTDAGYEETSSANQGEQFRTATFAKGESTVAVTTQATGDTSELIVLVD